MNFRKILWYKPRQDGTRDIKIYAYIDGEEVFLYRLESKRRELEQ